MKIGLLIQGPLVSTGRTGKTCETAKLGALSERDVKTMDCRENISFVINSYGDIFSEIVVSTWDDEPVRLNIKDPKVQVIYNHWEELAETAPDRSWISNSTVAKNNMLKQFKGCLEGAKKFDKAKTEWVLKMRTDQHFDINKLFLERKDFPRGKFGIPKHINRPYFNDFYFFSDRKFFLHGMELAIRADNEGKIIYSQSPHLQLLLKLAWHSFEKELPFDRIFYTEKGAGSLEQSLILKLVYDRYIYALPPEVAVTVSWRGDEFSEDSTWKNSFSAGTFNGTEHYSQSLFRRPAKVAYQVLRRGLTSYWRSNNTQTLRSK